MQIVRKIRKISGLRRCGKATDGLQQLPGRSLRSTCAASILTGYSLFPCLLMVLAKLDDLVVYVEQFDIGGRFAFIAKLQRKEMASDGIYQLGHHWSQVARRTVDDLDIP